MAVDNFLQLPAVTNAELTDVIAAVQGNITVQETLQQVLALVSSNLILFSVGNPNGQTSGTQFSLCFDTTNKILYICTTSGNSSTAVWTNFVSTSLIAGSNINLNTTSTGTTISAASGSSVLSVAGDPNGLLAGTTFDLCIDTVHNIMYVCTSSGSSSTAVWTNFVFTSLIAGTNINLSNSPSGTTISALATSPVISNAGNPNGALAGTIYDLCIDTTTDILYVCTTTGSSSSAVWTNFVSRSLIAGSNITLSTTSSGTTISAAGATGITWNVITGTSATLAVNNGYITENSSVVSLTLPTTSALGDIIQIVGQGDGDWGIIQNAGQQVIIGDTKTTIGVSGGIQSTNGFDSIYLVCTVANTTWTCVGAPQSGGITIV